MISPSALPANPKEFADVLKFGEQILDVCDSLGIETIVYGSLAYFAHTSDTTLPVRDLDLLVPESRFHDLMNALRALEGIRSDQKPYHSIEVYKGDLEVDLDSVEHFLDPRSRSFSDVTIGKRTFHILNRDSLISIYQEALDNMPQIEKLEEKRQRYTQKLENLKKS